MRSWYSGVFVLCGLFLLWRAPGNGAINGTVLVAATGLACLAAGVGLWNRAEWARWLGCSLGIFVVGFMVIKRLALGSIPSVWHPVAWAWGVWAVYDLWKADLNELEGMSEEVARPPG